jgi:hypothetical protein
VEEGFSIASDLAWVNKRFSLTAKEQEEEGRGSVPNVFPVRYLPADGERMCSLTLLEPHHRVHKLFARVQRELSKRICDPGRECTLHPGNRLPGRGLPQG